MIGSADAAVRRDVRSSWAAPASSGVTSSIGSSPSRAPRSVTIFDNSPPAEHGIYAQHEGDDRLRVVRGDVGDLDALAVAMAGHDTVIHLASNPDIARAMTEPAIDFDQGTLLTSHVVEAMRRTEASRVLYASGSGVYGDLGEEEAGEDHGPLVPVSTYGASKLAGEALICSYCRMFDLAGCVFRFGNVVGPRQTHGVGFDFVRRLLEDPTRLAILGDGQPVQVLCPCERRRGGRPVGRRPCPATLCRVQRRHRRLHHGERDRRAGRRGRWACPPVPPNSCSRGDHGVGRATCPWFGSTPTASAPSAGPIGSAPERRWPSR